MQNPIKKLPYMNLPDEPIMANTYDFLPIIEIVENVVLLKTGGACLVLESTSLNFGLLSEREQEAVIASYAALINSLSFPIQILVRTQKKDITEYLKYIDKALGRIENEKLKGLMVSYKSFIQETIKKKKVLGKRFFVIIPFYPSELGLKQSFSLGKKKKASLIPYSKEYVLKKARIGLFPKRDHLMRQSARLGLRLRQLERDELITLYYNSYNPKPEVSRPEDAQL